MRSLKYLKILKYLTIVSSCLFSVLALFSASKYFKIQIAPDSDLVQTPFDPAKSMEITNATADIFSLKGKPLGRTFVTADRALIITAAHVIAKECDSLPCQTLFIRVADLDHAISKKSSIFMAESIHCARWLDICAASSGPDASIALAKLRWSQQSNEPYYLAPFTEGNGKKFKKARFKGLSALGSLLEVNARAGYSGSPVFDSNGGLAGILSAGTETSLFFAPAFVLSSLIGSENNYFGESYMVAGNDIKAVLECKASRREKCFDLEAALLIKRFSSLSQNPNNLDFFLLDNSTFWNEWKGREPEFNPNDRVLAALYKYHKLAGTAEQDNVKKSLIKELEH